MLSTITEMNVELRDYENVKFANTEFEKLWEQSTPILPVDAPALIKKTYLDATLHHLNCM